MEYESRPTLHALVAYYCEPFGLLTTPRWVTLAEAVDYAKYGFCVLVDPQDERDLAMYERLERACQPPKRWFER